MKFDIKLFANLIRERKKEIIIVLIYIILFVLLTVVLNNKKIEKEDKEYDKIIAEIEYNTVKNITDTKDDIKLKVREKIKEYEDLEKKLPINLKNQNVNKALSDIINKTGNIFGLGNCKVSELKLEDNPECNAYQVKINSFNTTYYQFKNFLIYIKDNESKIKITHLDLNKSIDMVNGNMTLVFYGQIGSGEKL